MEKSGFFNAMKTGDTWDRIYKAENFAEYFASFIGNGVFPNPAINLQVKETDKMQVVVKAGKAWVDGFIYINTDDLVLDIPVADGVLHRIDKVVLRYDVAKREIRAVVKKGEFNSKPTAPILTRNADMYELGLADIQVNAGAIKISQADITDLRLNKEMCGIVHGTVDQVDTTAIFNQFQSWYSQTKDEYDKNIATWTKEKKEAFEEWYSKNTKEFSREFETWFKSLKNKLDGDIAGNLLNSIKKNSEKINSIKEDTKATLEENNKKIDKKVQEINSQYEDFKKKVTNDNTQNKQELDKKIQDFIDTKNKANGIAGLDRNGKIKKGQLPKIESGWVKIAELSSPVNCIVFENVPSTNFDKLLIVGKFTQLSHSHIDITINDDYNVYTNHTGSFDCIQLDRGGVFELTISYLDYCKKECKVNMVGSDRYYVYESNKNISKIQLYTNGSFSESETVSLYGLKLG